ncbi:GNAT family N-acetyltransferase [Carnobacterium sp. 17-4]|uniref:GNAT family N-acetyltransferase n=1 Tax=Carnobacterium sp. (strain 17-4) TaxID=208596 RepID=UPI00030A87C5|nr:GNAT family N-acetyltransferase [Carnobacterium sp. 17-4]
MNHNNLTLNEIEINDREKFIDYLLMADENEGIVEKYIQTGKMYSINDLQEIIGIILFTFPTEDVVEIKNLALIESSRGKGYGNEVIQRAVCLFQEKGYRKIIVGTANSSIGNISFYQKAGFRIVSIRKNFFLNYPELIIENGIRALDMILFENIL